MKKNKIALLLIVMLFSVGAFPQQEKLVEGKIIAKGTTVNGIIVLNLMNEKETRTNNEGVFYILAKPDDLLLFSISHLDGQRKIIEQQDYDNGKLTVEMNAKIEQLDEVVIIDYKRINAVDLGILSRPAKTYTPAERRLKTATSLSPTANMGTMMGGSISLDPLLNWMSGRTKLLKTELKVERNEFALRKLNDLYEKEFYIEKLKIPEDYIGSFKYYCIGDAKFVETLESKNKLMSGFLINMLAIQYNALHHEK